MANNHSVRFFCCCDQHIHRRKSDPGNDVGTYNLLTDLDRLELQQLSSSDFIDSISRGLFCRRGCFLLLGLNNLLGRLGSGLTDLGLKLENFPSQLLVFAFCLYRVEVVCPYQEL